MSLMDEQDDVVVSGIACRFQSDCVSEQEIYDFNKIDTEFLLEMNEGTKVMDAQINILIELTYEAILDAGISPQSLIASNTGVFVACRIVDCLNAARKTAESDGIIADELPMTSMADSTKKTFSFCGPALVLDSTVQSSNCAIDCAYQFIKSGACDAAVVAECRLNLTQKPLPGSEIASFFDTSKRLESPTGLCAIFIQKQKNSRRIYAHILNSHYSYKSIQNSPLNGLQSEPHGLLEFAQMLIASELQSSPSISIENPSKSTVPFRLNTKKKQGSDNQDERMVCWSARTGEAVDAIFDDITSRPLDEEHIALLQGTQSLTPDANRYRGFGFFKNDESGNASCIDYDIKHFDGSRRPIVFVYGGMGTQWRGMGRDLMQIPPFADSINKCHEIMLMRGMNFKGILSSSNRNVCESFLTSCLSIVAIEIALTDTVRALGVKPDFVIGHSVGEVACAYADGCLTAEEALTAAYLRAKLTLDSRVHGGALAAVGVHYTQLPDLPPEIDIACINGKHSTTISGPQEFMMEYVVELKVQKIPVSEVACAGIPFHSRYIRGVGEKLRKALTEVIGSPKRRSPKWITTSYQVECDESRFCDADYLASNFMCPVYFENAANELPKNALLIELSPHGILQSLLKPAVEGSVYVALTHRGVKDGKVHFMESIGQIFQLGVDLDIGKLYPAVDFPVSRGTPRISPVIKWNYKETCNGVHSGLLD